MQWAGFPGTLSSIEDSAAYLLQFLSAVVGHLLELTPRKERVIKMGVRVIGEKVSTCLIAGA